MKKSFIITFVSLLFLAACSLESEEPASFEYQVMPIESVIIPSSFVFGNTYVISMTYTAPSSCYEFYNFGYQVEGHSRTISVINTFYTDIECDEEPEEIEVSMDFIVTDTDSYVFKFYQGVDENGEDRYQVVEVPVTQ